MKFLCVPGGLVDSPNDDILYEMQIHNTMQTIGPLRHAGRLHAG